ncbi:MAG: amidase [Bacteroidetes bacterium]|nr:amidase [Bacteroidota bacterium]
MSNLSRRAFFESAAVIGVTSSIFPTTLFAASEAGAEITIDTIKAAEVLSGLSFTDAERELMLAGLQGAVEDYAAIRAYDLPNSVPPSLVFDPSIGGKKAPTQPSRLPVSWQPSPMERPPSDEELAFLTVPELSSLLKAGKVTSLELTELYLARLKQYDPVLECVVHVTEERARRQARAADAELAAGQWRGPLHGIPWGAKDLLNVEGYPTTWGAEPYRDQELKSDAEVVQRLDAAGAVLVAKLTLGALAMGDVWYGGRTNNPWNIERGSSGSSAGPGAAVAAGLVGFAIGSETLGSIVSPSTRNGVSGFRPTFGRVSRSGAMALSWTMDKLGPMCRSADGCALVFDAIHGHDPGEPTTVTTSFNWPVHRTAQELRVGMLSGAFENLEDRAVLDVLREAGVDLKPVEFPDIDPGPILMMLRVEAAAAFDQLTLTNRDDLLVRQDQGAWPTTFRRARFVPAVEYVNASRVRTVLMRAMKLMFDEIDVLVMPSFGNRGLSITNLTGHPSVTVPHHFNEVDDSPIPERRNPASITFVGGLWEDESALAVASLFQSNTNHHKQRPPIR